MNLSKSSERLPRRIRNELRFRPVEVLSKTLIANSFYRVEFGGEALAGFTSAGFDDHIKVFFPDAATGEFHLPEITEEGVVWKEGVRPAARDYTPLFFDGISRLTVDFYLHASGLASDWASRAQAGDRLAVGGPRGSLIVPEDYHFQLYVCDESGLPAFRRRCQTLSGESLRLYAFVDEEKGRDYIGTLPDVEICWLGSGAMHQQGVAALMTQLDRLALPEQDYFIWLTGEGAAVKQLSDYFIIQRGLQADFVRAVAYWHQKQSG
ncbi:siderophore-interacting protein [Erwinia mallotivora]|uniref:siderophore-interacting protein n=1 Tax=Erwinia mallotivora TaxID=69222 RepID=UPI0035EC3C2A